MSVSLVLLPVALPAYLVMRGVMGKEGFEKWLLSMQVRRRTTIRDKAALIAVLAKAGLDTREFGGLLKTHFRDGQRFFYWEQVDGAWVAVFQKMDAADDIETIARGLETVAGKPVLLEPADGPADAASLRQAAFPTDFRDPSLLAKALEDAGHRARLEANGDVFCEGRQFGLRFTMGSDDRYWVEVSHRGNPTDAYTLVSLADVEYKRGSQARTYKTLMERVRAKNLAVESEEIQPDNSIVVTLRIDD